MSEIITKVGMKPVHPGHFIRTEILDELDLSVSRAAEILGVRRATLSDLVNEKAVLSLSRTLRARDNGAADSIRWLLGASRRTTRGSSRLRAEKACGFPPFAAYPPPR
jgi:addiction module HigA family antidote